MHNKSRERVSIPVQAVKILLYQKAKVKSTTGKELAYERAETGREKSEAWIY